MKRLVLALVMASVAIVASDVLNAQRLVPPQAAGAGPFGFEAGMSREQIISSVGVMSVDAENSKGDTLWLMAAPRPNSSISKYVLVISPSRGLVRLGTISVVIPTDGEGSQLRAAFDAVVSTMSKRYGAPAQEFDSCTLGTYCTTFSAWVSGLLMGNRRLAKQWVLDEPIDSAYTVGVEVFARDLGSGYVCTFYEFKGFHQYEKEKLGKRATED